jgi:WD40 repeat protein
MKLPIAVTLSVVAFIQTAQAQNALVDPWPAPPAGSGFEKIFSYKPTKPASTLFMPLPQVGDKALELFTVPAAIQGRFILTANNSKFDVKRETVFGLVRVGGPTNAQPRVFYRNPAFSINFQQPFFSPNGKLAVIKTNESLRLNSSFRLWDIEGSRFLDYVAANPSLEREAGLIYGRGPFWSRGGRYLAYSRFRTLTIGVDENPSLCVLDTKTLTSHIVTQLPVSSDWSWTYQGEILLSTPSQNEDGTLASNRSVYALNLQAGTRTKLFDNGTSPQESPDGRWIAYFDHLENAGDSLDKSRGLYLWDKTTKTRQLVAPVDGEKYPVPQNLQWSPDGNTLYLIEANLDARLKQVEGTTKTHVVFDPKSPASYTISKMEMADKKLQKLAQIGKSAPIGSVELKSYGVSPDGTRLYYEFNQQVGENNVFIGKIEHTLFAVDTRTGAQTPIARLSNNGEFAGWDWHDDSGVNAATANAAKIEAELASINSLRQ